MGRKGSFGSVFLYASRLRLMHIFPSPVVYDWEGEARK